MKKMFTFLFFAGLMSTAMAQNGGYTQHDNQHYDSHGTPAIYANNGQANNGYGQPNSTYNQQGKGNNGYSQNNGYNQNNGYHQDEHGYNQNNEHAYGYGNDRRNDDRRFHDNDHSDQRYDGYERRKEYERYNRGRLNARVSVRFGQSVCF